MKQLTLEQTKEFFGNFEVKENASKIVMIDGRRYPNLIEACRSVYDNDIANEVEMVLCALGLQETGWSTMARGDYVKATAHLYGTNSYLWLKISSKGLGEVHPWNYNEGADKIVTPLLKAMGYVSTPLPSYHMRDRLPNSITGCKVRKLINGYNVEFTAGIRLPPRKSD